jgi:hemolysin type calcium-binding protein
LSLCSSPARCCWAAPAWRSAPRSSGRPETTRCSAPPTTTSSRRWPGDDTVVGFGGADRVQGGPGDDVIAGEGTCPSAGVVGSYCIPPGGAPGDDQLLGGPGADDIDGNRGADRIDSQGGEDRVRGSRGPDTINLGAGRDSVGAGRGNDTIRARDGARDRIGCGRGLDRVFADRRDRVGGTCERVRRPRS